MYNASIPAASSLSPISRLALQLYVIVVRDQSARIMKLDLRQFAPGTTRDDLMLASAELASVRLAVMDPDQSYPLLVPFPSCKSAFTLSREMVGILSLAMIDKAIDSDTVLFVHALAQEGRRTLVNLWISAIMNLQLACVKAGLEA